MKIKVNIKEFWNAVANIKAATSDSKITKRALLLKTYNNSADEPGQVQIASYGDSIFARTTFPCIIHSEGEIVMPINSLDMLSYLDGSIILQVKKNGKLRVYTENKTVDTTLNEDGTNPDSFVFPEYPEEWHQIPPEIFNIMYCIGGRNVNMDGIFVEGDKMATGKQIAYAGLTLDNPIPERKGTLYTPMLKTVPKNEPFELGYSPNTNHAWVRYESTEIAASVWSHENDRVVKYGWYEAGDIYFTMPILTLQNITNVIHTISLDQEKNDGRASLQLKDGVLTLEARGNEVGTGSISENVHYSNGDFTFGISTNLFLSAINNIDSNHKIAEIHLTNINDTQVLIMVGERTKHLITEDPRVR